MIPRLSPDVERVLSVIRAAGGHPMLVGGWVRDALMGTPGKDVDVEVYGMRGRRQGPRQPGRVEHSGRVVRDGP